MTNEARIEADEGIEGFIARQNQLHTARKILREIESTGNSVEFGAMLREFDSLARIGIQGKFTLDEQKRAAELEQQLTDTFGDVLADAVITMWASTENLRKPKTEPLT